MLDHTIKAYKSLLQAFVDAGFRFQKFEDYLSNPLEGKVVILRHDVDELADNALKMAKVEHDSGVVSTYFFRIVKQSDKPDVIRKIVSMGHAVGYHYEDLSLAEGDFEKARESFEKNLSYFRQYYPVKVVCMHGSSSSKYDNRLLWEKYDLSDYGLIGEPYLSLNFDEIFYMTDTGFAWDGGKYAIRDVVENKHGLNFHSTEQVIECIESGKFPEKSMILAHTLWSDNLVQWTALHVREFLRNNVKRIAQNSRFIAKIYNGLVKMYWKK